MYCASSKEGTVWCSVCDPVAQCILPNTKPTPGPQQICWKLASWTPAKPICWHILTHWSDGKWGGVVKNLIFRIGKMMINHRVSCAIFAIKPFWLLIKTNMLWFSHQTWKAQSFVAVAGVASFANVPPMWRQTQESAHDKHLLRLELLSSGGFWIIMVQKLGVQREHKTWSG